MCSTNNEKKTLLYQLPKILLLNPTSESPETQYSTYMMYCQNLHDVLQLQCDCCNRKGYQLDDRKIRVHSKKVGCGPVSSLWENKKLLEAKNLKIDSKLSKKAKFFIRQWFLNVLVDFDSCCLFRLLVIMIDNQQQQ